MRRGALALCTGLMLACLMPASAMAASEVDQKNETAQGAWLGGTYAQTFTVGKAGNLTGVDLYLNPDAAMSVDVAIQYIDRTTKAPNDVQKTHGTAVVAPPSGWRHFEFITPVPVLVGSQLAIVFTMYGGHVVGSTDKYPGGESWIKGPTWTKMGSDDLLFRTYVDTAPPTPAPTAPPTPAPTAPPIQQTTPKPAASPSATSAPTETTASIDTVASAPPTSAQSDGAETAAPTATITPGSEPVSGSGDSGASILPIVAIVSLLGLSLGGLGFLLLRRRRQQPTE